MKKQRHHFAGTGQSYGFSSSCVWMWELDHKEDWRLKNWCFWTMVLEKTLEGPMDCKGIQELWEQGPVDLKEDNVKNQRRYFANKGPSSQGYGFSSSQIWMWELDYKDSWVPKNGCFWTVVLEKTLESPLDCKGIQPVHPKGHQSWVFIGRTDVEVETLILWPPDAKSWLIWKDPDAEKDWGQ